MVRWLRRIHLHLGVFFAPLLVVMGIGALATWIPARRALKIDPSILLRSA